MNPDNKLLELVKEYPVRDFTELIPKSNDDWKFFYFMIIQQCGTGNTDQQREITCSDITNLYIDNWNYDRDLFGEYINYSEFKEIYSSSNKHIEQWRLQFRYSLHRDLVYLVDHHVCDFHMKESISSMVENMVLFSSSYNMDPLNKKRNLLGLILKARGYNCIESGPVVDYHIMRVLNRYYGNLDTTKMQTIEDAEYEMRAFAYNKIEQLATHFENEEKDIYYNKVDGLLYGVGNNFCHYELVPDCDNCPLQEGCSKKTYIVEPRITTFNY